MYVFENNGLFDLLSEQEDYEPMYSTLYEKKKKALDEPNYENTTTRQPEQCFYDVATAAGKGNDSS